MPKRKAPNLDGQGRTASTSDYQQCNYESAQFGRCRYYGVLKAGGDSPWYCSVHYFKRTGSDAELACESSLTWRRPVWDMGTGELHYVDTGEKCSLTHPLYSAAVRMGTVGSPRPRVEIKAKMKALTADPHTRSEPNLLHMHALLNAVESGEPHKWRRHPISLEEVAAAYRATGRKPVVERTEAGEDREEDAF